MRYRLRTLLILMAIAGLLFARVAYLKRMGDVHRREIARLLPNIVAAEGENHETIAASIDQLAAGDTALVVGNLEVGPAQPRVGVYDKDMTGRLVKDEATADAWREVVRHQVIANRYDRAMVRPWTVVSEATDRPTGKRVPWLFSTWTVPSDLEPPQPNPPLYQFKIRDPILLTLALSLGTVWWTIRHRRKTTAKRSESPHVPVSQSATCCG
jgi:hypothetical protein